jgi:hypothetical protein
MTGAERNELRARISQVRRQQIRPAPPHRDTPRKSRVEKRVELAEHLNAECFKRLLAACNVDSTVNRKEQAAGIFLTLHEMGLR